MKAQMILADAATAHPDGTVSMLRAWINQVFGQVPPFVLHGALAVRIEGEIGDSGEHQFDLRCLDADGGEAFPKLDGVFQVPKGGGATAVALNVHAPFAKSGPYVFILRVDRVQLADWRIEVKQVAQK